MLIAQISDLHIAAPGRKTYNIAPMAENLARVITHINKLTPRVDLVLVTGDLCDTGTQAETERARDLLDALACPYYIIPGNHDRRETLWQVFGSGAIPARNGPFLQYVVETGPLCLIALDSTIPGQPGGELCRNRLDWLAHHLVAAPDQPTLIMLHHPPLDIAVPETSSDGFIGAGAFGELIAQHRQVRRILCGHVHLPVHATFAGTAVSMAPAIGMQLTAQPDGRPSRFVLAPPGFLLHHWTQQDDLITHTIYLHEVTGPFPFADQPAKVT